MNTALENGTRTKRRYDRTPKAPRVPALWSAFMAMLAFAMFTYAPAAMAEITSANVSHTVTGNGGCDLDTSNADDNICTNANITYKFERTNDDAGDAPITYVINCRW